MARAPTRFPAHGPDLRALLAACQADPDDDTPRLVLADWLQEHDDPRGELMRLQCQLSALPAGDPEYDDLFARHQKWWSKYQNVWLREVGNLLWDRGPHDRGLPTLGHYDEEYCWLDAGHLGEPTPRPRDSVSRLVADGWPGMTWVFAEDPFEEYGGIPADPAADFALAAFDRAPWPGSPTPLGICFHDTVDVTPALIDRAAKLPNLRGLSFAGRRLDPELLPRIARIKALEHLDLGGTRLADDGAKALAPLKRLRTLIAFVATITNAGAAALAKLTGLRELRLRNLRLTAAGFRSLAGLTKLEVLELMHADDAAVRHLAPLTRLRRLELRDTPVTGRGVESFPLLTHLNLGATQADDAGLANLAALTRLRHLDLSNTPVTGATLAQVSGLRWLEELNVSITAVGNKDLVHLERLTNLETVDLQNTRVTRAGVSALSAKRKRTAIVW